METQHHAILEVDLAALKDNYTFFKKQTRPGTKLMAMVKANAYGLGAVPVAKCLENAGVDYLCVAYPEEAMELREAKVKLPILVMNITGANMEQLIEQEIEPIIFSEDILNQFTQALITKKIEQAYPIHIELNTGMNRLGFAPKDIPHLINAVADNPYVHVASIYSHFAVSDEETGVDFTNQQAQLFQESCNRLISKMGYAPMLHLSNTSGTLNYPEYNYDMVRIGIGLYGVSTTEKDKKNIKNVASLKSYISQINVLEKGETLSYGRQFTAHKTTRAATVSIGYADGVHRNLGYEKGTVFVNGKETKIIGTICMDMLMIDVTDIDCKIGDEVEIFGENNKIYTNAKASGTIPYELLTSVLPRVKRIYTS